jgi:arylsulfatase A-like enzyme
MDTWDLYLTDITSEQREKLILLYEQSLFSMDSRLGKFYEFLKASGMADQTLFMITSDHGEMLGEHGLWGHNFGVYNELIRIPLIIKYPKQFHQQGNCDNLVQLHDIYATVMDIMNVPVPPPESSQSLLSETREFAVVEHFNPWLGLTACKRRDPDFRPNQLMQPCRCIIDANFKKLIEWVDGRQELYDLRSDFAEQNNVINQPDNVNNVAFLMEKLQLISGIDAFNAANFPEIE